ncbi:MAG TPA: TIGR04211 family SH3 domain-containing protein [Steroidobacteraceae bacterium]|nr:TIGR04211 family SH3 domain-containing protein [Steroidobacteraceae bacterium]
MRLSTALLPVLMLAAASTRAATAFVSDELVLGVYAEQNGQGQRLATLHSGASVDTLSVNGEYTQVRLADGTTGWVKTIYLTTVVPATVRVKQLEEELDRRRATTPALAEAAARSEVEQLKRELSSTQAALDAATQLTAPTAAAPGAATPAAAAAAPAGVLAGIAAAAAKRPWMAVLPLLAALGCGFWLGYATLARRIKRKFGGLKVY